MKNTILRSTARLVLLTFASIACALRVLGANPPSGVPQGPQKTIDGQRPRVIINGFDELFAHPDEWAQTRSLVDKVLVADHSLDRNHTDDQLRPMFAQVKSWGLGLELEVGAVKPWGATGQKCFDVDSPKWDRFIRDGADIQSIGLDEPLTATRNALKLPDSYAVEQTADFIELVRQKYPQMQIGMIEAYPSISLPDTEKWITDVNDRLSQQGVRGLDFYRVDPNWVGFGLRGDGTWKDVAKLEQFCHSIHLPFSLIYWSSYYPALNMHGLAADDTWYEGIFVEAGEYALTGATPDQYCIESWIPNAPKQIVPEDGDFTYTRSVRDLVERFVGPR